LCPVRCDDDLLALKGQKFASAASDAYHRLLDILVSPPPSSNNNNSDDDDRHRKALDKAVAAFHKASAVLSNTMTHSHSHSHSASKADSAVIRTSRADRARFIILQGDLLHASGNAASARSCWESLLAGVLGLDSASESAAIAIASSIDGVLAIDGGGVLRVVSTGRSLVASCGTSGVAVTGACPNFICFLWLPPSALKAHTYAAEPARVYSMLIVVSSKKTITLSFIRVTHTYSHNPYHIHCCLTGVVLSKLARHSFSDDLDAQRNLVINASRCFAACLGSSSSLVSQVTLLDASFPVVSGVSWSVLLSACEFCAGALLPHGFSEEAAAVANLQANVASLHARDHDMFASALALSARARAASSDFNDAIVSLVAAANLREWTLTAAKHTARNPVWLRRGPASAGVAAVATTTDGSSSARRHEDNDGQVKSIAKEIISFPVLALDEPLWSAANTAVVHAIAGLGFASATHLSEARVQQLQLARATLVLALLDATDSSAEGSPVKPRGVMYPPPPLLLLLLFPLSLAPARTTCTCVPLAAPHPPPSRIHMFSLLYLLCSAFRCCTLKYDCNAVLWRSVCSR
jgi:hypothetical protein